MPLSPASSHGGGFTPVSCVLAHQAAIDIHLAANYPIKWTDAWDNVWDGNSLAALPSGLGITFQIDGSSAAYSVTASGLYAMTLDISFVDADDAAIRAHVQFGAFPGGNFGPMTDAVSATVTLSGVYALPSGASGTVQIVTDVSAAANPYRVNSRMSVVRLA